jgi:hypothetical protein
MAIFHLNESNISRSDGRSAVACAAYRACEKLEDLTYGKTQDYTKKNGLEYKNIYAPEYTNSDLLDRQTLWNTVEKKEFNANGSIKENARLAKEYRCALPHELTDQERIKIVDDFCRDFVKKHNVIVDACIHAPHQNSDGTHNNNYHVHIMFTTRLVNEKGELGKKQRSFNDNGPKILKDSRATFANIVNTALENAGLEERIDHRSHKDRGLETLPTKNEGVAVTHMRRRYEEEKKKPVNERDLDIILPKLAQENDAIKLHNLELEIIATEKLIQKLQKNNNFNFDDIRNKYNKEKSTNFDDLFVKPHQKASEENLFNKLDNAISMLDLNQKTNDAIDQFDFEINKMKAEAERKAEQAQLQAIATAKAEAERKAEQAQLQAIATAKAEAERKAEQAQLQAIAQASDQFRPF